MESFFDFIIGNFFIVIIVIVAIYNLFFKAKNVSEETSEAEEPRQRSTSQRKESPRSLQDAIEQKVEHARETFQQAKDTFTQMAEEMPKTVEEQRKEQYEQLRRRMQPTHRDNDHKNEHVVRNKAKHVDSKQADVEATELVVAHQLEKKLTRKGLAESIVMAEVLGPPRALNPYQNVAVRRKRK